MAEKPTYEELEQRIERLTETFSKNEGSFREIQKLAKIGNWEWDLEQQILIWSDEVYHIFGFEPAEFEPSAEAFEATIHPDDREDFLNQREAMLNEKQKACIDHRIVLPDGSVRYVQERTQLIFNNQNEICRVVGTVQDITERKRIEETLRKSEEKLRTITDSMADVVWTTDLELRIIYISPSIEKLTGYSVAEYKKRKVEERHTQASLEKMGQVLGEELENEKNPKAQKDRTRFLEVEVNCKNGTKITEMIVSFIRDYAGKPIGILGTERDITERKKAEEALQESETKLKNIVENSTTLFYSHTPDHILTYLSPQVEDILGYTQEEATIEWPKLASDNPINEIGFQNTVKAIETGKRQPPYALELVRKDGEKIWCEIREFPNVSDDKTTAIIGSLTDITERRRMQIELHNLNLNLEQRVQKRTAELEDSNAALRVLLKQRQYDRSELGSRVVSNAKELIKPYLAKLHKTDLTAKQQNLVETLESNIDSIVSPFVDKLESRYHSLTPMEIRVAVLVKDGKTNKEIAGLLGVSLGTILTHRHHVRAKLGLKNTRTNLRTHLLSFN